MRQKDRHVLMIIDYIEHHLSQKIQLEDIANAIGYSKYHLHRVFSGATGISIHDYVLRRQLTEAAKLLVFSNKSIIEISLIAGYESQQAFTLVFKQFYKKTPNEYRNDEEFYPLQLKFNLKKGIINKETVVEVPQHIRFAKLNDITKWMDLVQLLVDGFPMINLDEYQETLGTAIKEKRALMLEHHDIAIAIMIMNFKPSSIDFFGIHPLYRDLGIAKTFIHKVLNDYVCDEEIIVTTFREGDKADSGYRKTYKEIGFAEAELLVEYGYPTQKMILRTHEGSK